MTQPSKGDIRHAVVSATSLMHWVTSDKALLERYTAWLNEGCGHPEYTATTAQVRMSLHMAHDVLAPDCDEPIEAI